jgi:hypothetical protein
MHRRVVNSMNISIRSSRMASGAETMDSHCGNSSVRTEAKPDRDDVAQMSTADAITALYSQLRNYPAAAEARSRVRRPAPIFQLDATLPASNQSVCAIM